MKIKRIGNFILIVIAALALMFLLATTILNHLSRRRLADALEQMREAGEPLELAAMVLPEVSDDENAALVFEVLGPLIHLEGEEQIHGKEFRKLLEDYFANPGDSALREQFLLVLGNVMNKSVNILKYIDKAAECEKCAFLMQYCVDDPSTIGRHHITLRRSASFLRLRAFHLAANDKPDAALDSIGQILKISRFAGEGASLFEHITQFRG